MQPSKNGIVLCPYTDCEYKRRGLYYNRERIPSAVRRHKEAIKLPLLVNGRLEQLMTVNTCP